VILLRKEGKSAFLARRLLEFFEKSLLFQLSQQAHINEVFELERPSFSLFADLIKDGLDARLSRIGTRIEDAHTARKGIVDGFGVIGLQSGANRDFSICRVGLERANRFAHASNQRFGHAQIAIDIAAHHVER